MVCLLLKKMMALLPSTPFVGSSIGNHNASNYIFAAFPNILLNRNLDVNLRVVQVLK